MISKVEELLKNATGEEFEELQRQLSEYQDKLSELDEIEEDIDYREGHATAGYVYVISNIVLLVKMFIKLELLVV